MIGFKHTPVFIKLFSLLSLAMIGGCIGASPIYSVNDTLQLAVKPLSKKEVTFKLINPLPYTLHETSGLARHNGRIWSINDSGDKANLYRLSDDWLSIDKTIRLTNGTNKDWESLASNDEHLIIADCGNNSGNRRNFELYHITWQTLEQAPDLSSYPGTVQHFNYKNQPEKNMPYHHNYDCEAVTLVQQTLWLFSKNWQDGHTFLYHLALDQPHQTLSPVARLNIEGLITGADYNEQNNTLALVGYTQQRIFGSAFVWLFEIENSAIKPDSARYFELPTYAQWEGIVWQDPSTLILTTEQSPISKSQIATLSLKKSD